MQILYIETFRIERPALECRYYILKPSPCSLLCT
uniref:Uncharacterized protein n=1 Tax=Arundo donax TaxID=35708 RepID=A0A0A9F8J1_ARUDO